MSGGSAMPVRRWLSLVLAAEVSAAALGVLAPPSCAQGREAKEQIRRAQEDEILAAALAFFLSGDRGGDRSFYCLAISRGPSHKEEDPPDSLLARLPGTGRLRKASQCELVGRPEPLVGAVKDKATGKAAQLVSVSVIRWIDDENVEVGAQRYCGGLCGAWTTLRVFLRKDRWTAAPGGYLMVM